MAKSGQQRKSKRKARQKAEKALPSVWKPSSEDEAKENNKLVRRYLRWNTEATESTDTNFNKLDFRQLPAKDIALLVTRRNMLSIDQQVSNAAVRNLIAMESQNQNDEKAPAQHLHVHAQANNPFENASDDAIIQAKLAIENLKKSAKQSK